MAESDADDIPEAASATSLALLFDGQQSNQTIESCGVTCRGNSNLDTE